MSQQLRKQNRIKKIIDDAAKALEAEGVKYFIGVVDRQPKAPNGGKAYAQSDIKGEDFCYILDMALPTRQDLVNLGIWVGQLLTARKNENRTI
jgi:hypothetical protein